MEAVLKDSVAMASEDNALIAKVVAMIALGMSSFIIGLLPLKLAKIVSLTNLEGEKNLLLSLMLCFGGGVLLFTTFLHLQPEVREFFNTMEAHGEMPDMRGIPPSELVFCFGFFLVYLIEEVVHAFLDRKSHSETLRRSLSIRISSRKTDNMTIPRVTLTKFDDGNISYISNSNKELLESQTTINVEKQGGGGGGHSHASMDGSIKNPFSGFLAVLALSFHAIFEGLAVGLEKSSDKVWYLLAAIATHKLVIAFCVGVELVSTKTKVMLVMLYIGTLAIVSPIGIGIGIILSNVDNQENVVCVALQGMAAGTLLYVVFFEVLARERDNNHSGVWQLLAILVGFMFMFTLQTFTGHEHSHGPNGDHDHHYHESSLELTTPLQEAANRVFSR